MSPNVDLRFYLCGLNKNSFWYQTLEGPNPTFTIMSYDNFAKLTNLCASVSHS